MISSSAIQLTGNLKIEKISVENRAELNKFINLLI